MKVITITSDKFHEHNMLFGGIVGATIRFSFTQDDLIIHMPTGTILTQQGIRLVGCLCIQSDYAIVGDYLFWNRNRWMPCNQYGQCTKCGRVTHLVDKNDFFNCGECQ